MRTFAEYLAGYRTTATLAADATVTDASLELLVKDEYLRRHEAPVWYEKLGQDATGPVYRLGTAILLLDVQSHLDALVTAGKIKRMNYANAYSCNPSLRTPR
jgi:hypothetical protein